MSAVARAVDDLLRAEAAEDDGYAAARARLADAILADRQRAQRRGALPHRLRPARWTRQTALLAVLLALLTVAVAMRVATYQRACSASAGASATR